MRVSRDRRAAIVELARAVMSAGDLVVDVGADHGHVAHALGGIATERAPGRSGRTDVPWVLADGLRGVRRADVAVIAGMGFRTIAGILERGPTPRFAVLHAPDDPQSLRLWLGEHGFRIDDETLAKEGPRYAEVIRVVPGTEPHRGETLALGPLLCRRGHPLLVPHLERLRRRLDALARATEGHQPDKHAACVRRVRAIDKVLAAQR
jgi:tRNA A22 N-methylase